MHPGLLEHVDRAFDLIIETDLPHADLDYSLYIRHSTLFFMDHENIIKNLLDDLKPLRFGAPVTHVYNPLEYARAPYLQYCRRYGLPEKEIVLIGMNPGPWGMAQTGIPFGEITAVKEWMSIDAPIGQPVNLHPKRPVTGFKCTRSEVSGKRLWGWAQATFKTPDKFFSRFFVANYCPLQFIEFSGRNRTPNQLRKDEKSALLTACDRALNRTIKYLKPRYVIGVGKFACERARTAISDPGITIGSITHPSPANPRANRGWDALIMQELQVLGIQF